MFGDAVPQARERQGCRGALGGWRAHGEAHGPIAARGGARGRRRAVRSGHGARYEEVGPRSLPRSRTTGIASSSRRSADGRRNRARGRRRRGARVRRIKADRSEVNVLESRSGPAAGSRPTSTKGTATRSTSSKARSRSTSGTRSSAPPRARTSSRRPMSSTGSGTSATAPAARPQPPHARRLRRVPPRARGASRAGNRAGHGVLRAPRHLRRRLTEFKRLLRDLARRLRSDAAPGGDRARGRVSRPCPSAARTRAVVLDLCCGSGRHLAGLAHLGYEVTDIERDPDIAHRARARVPAARILEGDANRLARARRRPVRRRRLSLVELFGYGSVVENTALLGALAAVLEPGGRLVLDVYNRTFFRDANRRADDGARRT